MKKFKLLSIILAAILSLSLLAQPVYALDPVTLGAANAYTNGQVTNLNNNGTTYDNNQIAGLSSSIPVSAKSYGASGINTTTTGTISASSNSLSLTAPDSFANGQGIVVSNAGAAPSVSAPTGLTTTPSIGTLSGVGIAQAGTPGSTNYSYRAIAVDANNGYTAAPTATSTGSGPATLNGTNYNALYCTAFPGAVKYAWYRTASSGSPGTTGYIGETTVSALNGGTCTGSCTGSPVTLGYNASTTITLNANCVNTTLASAVGSGVGTINSSSAVGLAAGESLVLDTGGVQETVTVAGSYAGGLTIPLTAGTTYAHSAGVSLTTNTPMTIVMPENATNGSSCICQGTALSGQTAGGALVQNSSLTVVTSLLLSPGSNSVNVVGLAGSTFTIQTTDLPWFNDTGLAVISPPSGIPSSPPPSAVGTTSYTYAAAAIDNNGAITSDTTVTTAVGWAAVSATNSIALQLTPGTGDTNYLYWRTASGGSPSGTGFIGICNSFKYNDWGTDTECNSYVQGGNTTIGCQLANGVPYSIPVNPSVLPWSAPLRTTVSSGGGTTTLTLAASATTAASGKTVFHDDSVALQTAFNLGGNIYIPAGSYNVFKSLAINNSNTHIYGAGIDVTTLNSFVTCPGLYSPSSAPCLIYSNLASELQNIMLQGITFNCNYFPGVDCDGVDLYNVDNSEIYQCKVTNAAGSCLAVTGCLTGSGASANYTYPGYKIIKDCVASNCGGEVFASFYDNNVIMTGNYGINIFNFICCSTAAGGGEGAWIQALCCEGSQNCTVSNNQIYNLYSTVTGAAGNGFQDFVDCTGSLNDTITDNLFINPAGTPLAAAEELIKFNNDSPEYPETNIDVNWTVSGNTFSYAGTLTAYVDGGVASNITITHNNFTDGGIYLTPTTYDGGSCNNLIISNNSFDDQMTATAPIELFPALNGGYFGDGATISNNTITCDSSSQFVNHTIGGSQNPGIWLYYVKDLTLTGNNVEDTPYYAIWLRGCTDITVNDNITNYGTINSWGTEFNVQTCSVGTISGNYIGYCAGTDFFLNGDGSLTVSGNEIPSGTALAIASAVGKITLTGNDLTGGNVSIDGPSLPYVIVSNNTGYNNAPTDVTGYELTTTGQTTVATYTPPSAGNFEVAVTSLRVVTGATVITVVVTWTDAGGAESDTVLNAQSAPVGSNSLGFPVYINDSAGGAISVKATAGTANQVYVSASILPI